MKEKKAKLIGRERKTQKRQNKDRKKEMKEKKAKIIGRERKTQKRQNKDRKKEMKGKKTENKFASRCRIVFALCQ
jgi:hypothetical protein